MPQRLKFEDLIFNFVRLRKVWIGALVLSVVGSLYVVTYPNVSERLVYSDSKLKGLADDPALLKYSNYQANLVNPTNIESDSDEFLPDEESTTVSTASLEQLITTNTKMLEFGLSQTSLSSSSAPLLSKIASDMSPFERSACSFTDSIQPVICVVGKRIGEQKTVALIGDSKLAQYAQPMIEYFSKRGWVVEPYILNGCNMFSPKNTFKKNCTKRSEWVLSKVMDSNFDLVIASSYPTDMATFAETSSYIDTIIESSKQTILLTQFPRVSNPRECVSADFTYKKSCSDITSNELLTYNQYKELLKSKKSATTTIIDTTRWTCVDLSCPIASGDLFIVRDGSHLTYSFINKITPIINLTLDSIVNR